MKLYFASTDNTGCGHYRSFLPAKHLVPFFPGTMCGHGFKVGADEIADADVIILQRHVSGFFVDWIPHARALGKIILYDIDDSFWHIPTHNPAAKAFTKPVVKQIERIISLCNGVITSTQPLAKHLARFNSNVLVIPNLIETPTVERKQYSERLKIGWGGSITHAQDFSSKVVTALRHCQKKYDAQLIFLGMLPAQFATDKDVIHIPGCAANIYMNQLYLADIEIAVAPLEENYFNECKSNLKFLEYGICGSAVVASDAYPYKNTITHGWDGYVVKKNQWLEYLIALCEDAKLRQSIQGNAYQSVLTNYTWKNRAVDIAAAYKSFIEAAK